MSHASSPLHLAPPLLFPTRLWLLPRKWHPFFIVSTVMLSLICSAMPQRLQIDEKNEESYIGQAPTPERFTGDDSFVNQSATWTPVTQGRTYASSAISAYVPPPCIATPTMLICLLQHDRPSTFPSQQQQRPRHRRVICWAGFDSRAFRRRRQFLQRFGSLYSGHSTSHLCARAYCLVRFVARYALSNKLIHKHQCERPATAG